MPFRRRSVATAAAAVAVPPAMVTPAVLLLAVDVGAVLVVVTAGRFVILMVDDREHGLLIVSVLVGATAVVAGKFGLNNLTASGTVHGLLKTVLVGVLMGDARELNSPLLAFLTPSCPRSLVFFFGAEGGSCKT